MPPRGVLDLQRRSQQIGRIRIGRLVDTGKTNRDGSARMRPASSDTFRITTQSKMTARAVAELFGGEVRPWQNELEVVTDRSEIAVTIPPRDQVISQSYEMWTAGGCQRRCDSQTEQISGGPCQCPHADNPADEEEVARKAQERAALAAQNPPRACKLVTRISVMIPDLPGLGVFRLDTGSYYAGVEIGDAAQLMEMARDAGVFLPAILRIDHRSRVVNGETKKYPVPVLEVTATFRQIASGELQAAGIAGQLPPAPGGDAPKAITAGVPDSVPGPVASGSSDAPAPRPEPATPVSPAGPGTDPQDIAQDIAGRARDAATSEQMVALGAEAEAKGVLDEYVSTGQDDADGDGIYEPLRDYLRELWVSKR